jgi:hypothetical protein
VTLETRDIDRALTDKGFSKENAKHHTMYWLHVDGKKTSIRTRISFGESEIGSPLISLMAREMRVSKAEFLVFVACEMSGLDYRDKMISEGQIRVS